MFRLAKWPFKIPISSPTLYLIPNRMDIFYFLVLSIPMLLLNTYSTFPPYLHFPKVPVVPYHLLFLHTCLATIPSHLHSHLCMDSMLILFFLPFPTQEEKYLERENPPLSSPFHHFTRVFSQKACKLLEPGRQVSVAICLMPEPGANSLFLDTLPRLSPTSLSPLSVSSHSLISMSRHSRIEYKSLFSDLHAYMVRKQIVDM